MPHEFFPRPHTQHARRFTARPQAPYMAALACSVLLWAGCGQTTPPNGTMPKRAPRAGSSEKFAVSFSADVLGSTPPRGPAGSSGTSLQEPAGTRPGATKSAQRASESAEPAPGRIIGVVKWNGPLPALDPVLISKDTHVCAEHGEHVRPSERLVVNPANGGIKDSVVYLAGRFENGKPLSELIYPGTLTQRTCSYEPRVFAVPVGTKLVVTSEDEVGHNVRMSGAADLNIAVSKGGRSSRRLDRAGLVKVGCDIHPWMTGYIHVVKHPYYAVTDADGHFELTGVPADTYQIELWHEAWWTEDGKVVDPIVVTRSATVHAGETTRISFEFSDPTQKRTDGGESAESKAKRTQMR